MPGIAAMTTVANAPNYVGELFTVARKNTKLLAQIGILNGGTPVEDPRFEWQKYDLRSPGNRVRKSAAKAPEPNARTRQKVDNNCQTIHEHIKTAWRKQAATGYLSGLATAGGVNPVRNEHAWQVTRELEQIALDMEYALMRSTRNQSADASTDPWRTRGLVEAIINEGGTVIDAGTALSGGDGTYTVTVANPGVFTTGAVHGLAVDDQVYFVRGSGGLPRLVAIANDSAGNPEAYDWIEEGVTYFVTAVPTTTTLRIAKTKGGTDLEVTDAGTTHATRLIKKAGEQTKAHTEDLSRKVYDAGGWQEGEMAQLVVGTSQRKRLTSNWKKADGSGAFRDTERFIAGVRVDTLITDFAEFGVQLNHVAPNGAIVGLSTQVLGASFLAHELGFLYITRLGVEGTYTSDQIVGEWGTRWGMAEEHGIVIGLKVDAD